MDEREGEGGGGGAYKSPPRTPPIKGRFHAVRQAEWPERGKTVGLRMCASVLWEFV